MGKSKQASNVIPFHTARRSPGIVRTVAPSFTVAILIVIGVISLPSLIGSTDRFADASPSENSAAPSDTEASPTINRTFVLCGAGARTNCVVDGDTFWLDGVKIRITGIDAPETHPARCAREEQLGQAATQRLIDLLNAGSFELRTTDRDHDRYGRDLRDVYRGGASLGDQLVREGLARPYDGPRRSWCD